VIKAGRRGLSLSRSNVMSRVSAGSTTHKAEINDFH
jgi:hypothetical protein